MLAIATDLLPVPARLDRLGLARERALGVERDAAGDPGTGREQLRLLGRGRHSWSLDEQNPNLFVAAAKSYVSASAPATTSRISWVISAWRARFICSVSPSISSPAFFDALRIAVIRAPCSDAADSSRAR
jgi:hypothetical protein